MTVATLSVTPIERREMSHPLDARRIYGSLSSPKCLPNSMGTNQDDLIEGLIFDEHFSTYPPSVSYQRVFWKHVVNCIEAADEVRELIASPQTSKLTMPSGASNDCV